MLRDNEDEGTTQTSDLMGGKVDTIGKNSMATQGAGAKSEEVTQSATSRRFCKDFQHPILP